MNCDKASPASDLWGVGVITYQLLSGGVSPFFAINRFRTMARVLEVDYSLDQTELHKVSSEGKDFISRLLVKDPEKRLTASQCLNHPWLHDEKIYLGILQTLETRWMRRCLARRRWYRFFNAIRVMKRVRSATEALADRMVTASSSDEEKSNGLGASADLINPYTHPLARYHRLFDKVHLISHNGTFGTVFSVQHKESKETYWAKHVKAISYRMNLREEASILRDLKNVANVVQLEGLYEGPNQSILVFDECVGGDLAERVSTPGFELNENKCRQYIRQVCRGLAFLHQLEIVHLDLKPFNILFANKEEDSVLKIADFALAKRLSANPEWPAGKSTKIDQILASSVEFLAPEMVECTFATCATDAWSLGIIAYMLVTGGKSPFFNGNRVRTISKIIACQYDLHGSEFTCISRDAKSFIMQQLQRSQGKRMSLQRCLEHRWLASEAKSAESLQTLEVRWMKKLLARRRWHRWYNTVRATQRIRKLSAASSRNLHRNF